MLGRVLNKRYKIEEKIGAGGMALVYRGQDQILGRKVAIKVLRPQFASDTNFVRRFWREAKAAACLNHPHIVKVFDIGQEDDLYYLVLENIEGQNLKEKITQEAPLPLAEGLKILEEICEALVSAHRNGLVHCDIKPHNILLAEEGGVKVTDFGIARAMSSVTMTHTESVIGSAHYISPEQAKGENVGPSCDIYSLGIVAYEMFSGRLPFKGQSPITVALKHIRNDPDPPSRFNPELPSFVERIIMQALEKEPEDRLDSARSMLEAIREAIKFLPEKQKDEAEPDDSPTLILKLKDRLAKEELQEQEQIDLFEDGKRKPFWRQWAKKERTSAAKQDTAKRPSKKKERTAASTNKAAAKKEKRVKKDLWPALMPYRYYILTFFLIVLVLFGSWLSYKAYMNVPIAEVPDLYGLSQEEAKALLRQAGFSIVVQDEQYHGEIPKGYIVSQVPAAEDTVRVSRKIGVIISRGPVWSEVPDLKGMTLREAEVILGAAGLQLGEIQHEFDEEVPRNAIVMQTPRAGEEIKADDRVDIVISQGSATLRVEVPDLIGLVEAEAERLALGLGLNIGEASYSDSTRYMMGQVTHQEPNPGMYVAEGATINLTVSQGIINPDNAPVYSPGIRVPVPPGQPEQAIKIVIEDNNGREVIYQQIHRPGERVYKRVNTVGPTIVQVYINEELAKEEKIGF